MACLLKNKDVSYLNKELLNEGLLQIKPASFYDNIPQDHLAIWCHKNGIYGLPTTELIDWLKNEIIGDAIEIGAGNGSIGRAFDIPITDACVMKRPEVQLYYKMGRQPITTYPEDIIELSAIEAISKYKPDTVIGCWVTHLYQEDDSDRGGSIYGIDEKDLLTKVKKYIVIGNKTVHGIKKILERDHKEYTFPWLFSKSMHSNKNIIYVWEQYP